MNSEYLTKMQNQTNPRKNKTKHRKKIKKKTEAENYLLHNNQQTE